jgi:hypothetical protein
MPVAAAAGGEDQQQQREEETTQGFLGHRIYITCFGNQVSNVTQC